MISSGAITFALPVALWALLLVPVLVPLFLYRERIQRRRLQQLAAARLLPRLAGSVSVGRRRLRFALCLLAWVALVLALARPQAGFILQPQTSRGRDLLIAVDTSRSMLANDLQPTRLARAKLAAEDLLLRLPGDRVGLIAFAGTAFLQAPITGDHAAVRTALHELDTEIIPQGGTNLTAAIEQAEDAFGKGEGTHRALIIFTDGEELSEDGLSAAKKLEGKVRIYTVGVGSPEGTIIALPGEGGRTEYLKSPDGQIVKSRLDEKRLRDIAEATGGLYVLLRSGPAEMQHLAEAGLATLGQKEGEAEATRIPIERYQWPLGAALVLLLITYLLGERRKGSPAGQSVPKLALLVAAFVLAAPAAQAADPGMTAYSEKRYADAETYFRQKLEDDPTSAKLRYNLGTALYQQGKYNNAIGAFSGVLPFTKGELRTSAAYNLGNSLLQQGLRQPKSDAKLKDYEDAEGHYEAVLKDSPQHEGASNNLKVVRKLIEDEKKKTPPQDQQEQDKKDQKDKQDQKDQQQKDQQQKDGQRQDQKQQKSGQQDSKEQSGEQKSGDQTEQQSGAGQEKGEQQQKPGEGKDGQSGEPQQKDGQGKDQPGQEGQSGQEQTSTKDGSKDGQKKRPEPQPDTPDRNLQGEIAGTEPNKDPGTDPGEGEREAMAAAAGGLTPNQAANILESLRQEDERVRLLEPGDSRDPQKAPPPGKLRDW